MKMPQEWYEKIKVGITQIVEFYGVERIKSEYAELTTNRLCWDLYHILMQNWGYDDTHPFYVNGAWQRIMPFCDISYRTIYNLNLHDSHILTALKKIVKELDLA